jgi:FkbM family methyltransferase
VGEISLDNQLEDLLSQDPSEVISLATSKLDRLIPILGENFVLFGAGRLGLIVLAGLRKVKIEPIAFTDNNSNLWGTSVEGIKVISPDESIKLYGKNAIFVISVYTNGPIWDQLNPLDIEVVSFPELAWKYPDTLLPHGDLELPYKIFDQANEVKEAFKLWDDGTSRKEYLGQLKWHTSLDRSVLPAHLPQQDIYFPEDLIIQSANDVFVDCGAFDGDTVRDFIIRKKEAFKQIVAIEPDPVNCQSLNNQNSRLNEKIRKKIVLMQNAVGSQKELVKFNVTGTAASSVGKGTYEVECSTLDELLLNYAPTFIKMDIEGAELEALKGAQKIIGRYTPIMAVCMYHRQEHLWKIPQLLNTFSSQYKFFFRRYSDECWELVCYAIPLVRLKSKDAAK